MVELITVSEILVRRRKKRRASVNIFELFNRELKAQKDPNVDDCLEQIIVTTTSRQESKI